MTGEGVSPEVVVYTTRFCSYCLRAKRLLDARGASYREVLVDGDPEARREMERRTGRRTVPQIFIGDLHVGGYDSLWALESAGELDRLLPVRRPAESA